MNRDLTPTEGVRLLLERERVEHDGVRAVYKAAIYTPTSSYEGLATLAEDGSVAVDVAAPAELAEMLTMVARLTARSATKKREDGLPPWPQRVLRWRGPGRGE